ncbi:leucine-rich repeat-containing protein 70-like [Dendronephthya gigantea]|uniref:leucine-rich repeat-containing protein 70-like n=2 Tax=Dendronephthya gigantea TaxID=151771 RepID=UPI00106C3A34|nr:leucine-rich repeat-containing protein 70-like [Dendronephthya gigantea]
MLKNLPLSLVLLSSVVYLVCVSAQQRIKKCPQNCKCYRSNAAKGLDVDCSNQRLTDLPSLQKNIVTLVMSDNQMVQLLPRSFTRTKRIQNIYLYRNRIWRVHWEAFQGLRTLQILSLFGNQITELNNGTFKDLSSLKKIYLYQNKIRSLNTQTFVGLSSLEFLSLRDNDIQYIEPGTFAPLVKLESLFLFRNNLTKLTNGMFQGLSSLRTLIIGFNRISEIENEAFQGLSGLTELYLDNNKLERVTSRMFADLVSLRKLHIYHNDIKTIDPGSFFRLQELNLISAHNNRLNLITRGTLAGLRAVRVLEFQANEIAHIDSKSFLDLRDLRTLYLYRNNISIILKDAFLGLENLVDLHLGLNMISEIEDNAFQELKKLTTLYLDSNRLTRISKGTLSGLTSLLDLYLYFNQITYVANNAFVRNPLLRFIAWDLPISLRIQERYRNITGNMLFCDCHAMYFKRWLTKHAAMQVSCYNPPGLRGTMIKTLTKEDLEKCHDPEVKVVPAKATVGENGLVSIHCTGSPAVEFIWYRNGSRIVNQENAHVSSFGTLLLRNIQRSDAGTYICAAKNKKSFAVATASLTVGHEPYFTSSPESVEAFEGSKIILTCKAISKPPSKIIWRKYDEAVNLDDERVFQTIHGSLIITDASLSDEGLYSCIAVNELASISKEAQVVVRKGKDVNQGQIMKCGTDKTEKDIDVSGSGSGSGDNDDDDGSDDDDNDDIDKNNDISTISSSRNDTVPTTRQTL